MRILLNGFMVFLLWAVPVRYAYVCQIKGHCSVSESVKETSTAATSPEIRRDFQVVLADQILADREHFTFEGVRPLLSTDNEAVLDSIAAYMQSSSDKTLLVTGAWMSGEEEVQAGFFENPGLARAAQIRDALVRRGIAEERIGLAHREEEGPELDWPLDFVIKESAGVEAEAFTFTNMNFSGANFATGSAVFNPNPRFQTYADSLIVYMRLHPDQSLTITGHTDSRGAVEGNQALGLERAEAVKRYLLQKGLKSKIITRSAGATEPIGSNETEEGRASNRRVNLKIH